MSTTLIEFYDKSPLENIVSSLALRPDKVIFLGSNRKLMERQAQKYIMLFEERGISPKIECRAMNKNEFSQILDALNTVTDENPNCIVDLTGGDEIALVAVGAVAETLRNKNKNIAFHRINVNTRKVVEFFNTDLDIDAEEPTLNAFENIMLYGGRIVYNDEKDGSTYCWNWSDEFIHDVNAMWEICKSDCDAWNAQFKQLENIITKSGTSIYCHLGYQDMYGEPIKLWNKKLFFALEEKKLISKFDSDKNSFAFDIKNDQIRRVLCKTGMDDEFYNLPMTICNSARFGGKETTMIHIVSKPYMLRDFFFANAETYLASESHINMFMTCIADTVKLAVFRLLYEMKNSGLPEDEIIERIELLQPPSKSLYLADTPIRAALAYCIKKVADKEIGNSLYRYFSFRKKTNFNAKSGDFDTYYMVSYKDRNAVDELLSEGRLAGLSISGNSHKANFFEDGIFQRYLPRQYMVYNGNSYQISDFRNGTIYLKSGRDDCKIPAAYTQIRRYVIDNTMQNDVESQNSDYDVTWDNMFRGYELKFFHAPIEVNTLGYYEHPFTGGAFNHLVPTPIHWLTQSEQIQVKRTYTAANVLSLKIKGKFGADTDKATFLLAVVLIELRRTLDVRTRNHFPSGSNAILSPLSAFLPCLTVASFRISCHQP